MSNGHWEVKSNHVRWGFNLFHCILKFQRYQISLFRILQKLGIVQMLMFPFGQFFMQENTQEVDRGTTYAKQSQCCPQSAGLFLLTNDLYLFLNGWNGDPIFSLSLQLTHRGYIIILEGWVRYVICMKLQNFKTVLKGNSVLLAIFYKQTVLYLHHLCQIFQIDKQP